MAGWNALIGWDVQQRADALNAELEKRRMNLARSHQKVGNLAKGTMICGKAGRPLDIVAGDGSRSVAQIVGDYLVGEGGSYWTAARVAEHLDHQFELPVVKK